VAHRTGAIEIKVLERVAVDTTLQEKAITHPSDARLTHRAIVFESEGNFISSIWIPQILAQVIPEPNAPYSRLFMTVAGSSKCCS
jgi:hypothetical protein